MTTTTVPSVPWIGDDETFRVAAEVPADIQRAINAYETARIRHHLAGESYKSFRDAGCPMRAQDALASRQTNARLMEQWWGWLEARLPMETGWWPHGGWIYGFAKRDGCGLKLVRRRGSETRSQPAKASAWRRAEAEDRRAKQQFEAFCARCKS